MTFDVRETIGYCMQRDLQGVSEDTCVLNAASLMAARRIGSLVVHPAGAEPPTSKIIGLLSETDLIRRVMAKGLTVTGTTVGQVMASPLQSIPSDRLMLDASHFMEKHGIRHVCVAEGGSIVGLISVRDLVVFLTNLPRK